MSRSTRAGVREPEADGAEDEDEALDATGGVDGRTPAGEASVPDLGALAGEAGFASGVVGAEALGGAEATACGPAPADDIAAEGEATGDAPHAVSQQQRSTAPTERGGSCKNVAAVSLRVLAT